MVQVTLATSLWQVPVLGMHTLHTPLDHKITTVTVLAYQYVFATVGYFVLKYYRYK